MISDSDAQKCMGFLEVVRTMIDNAEVEIASATRSKEWDRLLNKAVAQVGVASKNLMWCTQEIVRITLLEIVKEQDASAANRPTAGNAMEPTQQKGSDKLPV